MQSTLCGSWIVVLVVLVAATVPSVTALTERTVVMVVDVALGVVLLTVLVVLDTDVVVVVGVVAVSVIVVRVLVVVTVATVVKVDVVVVQLAADSLPVKLAGRNVLAGHRHEMVEPATWRSSNPAGHPQLAAGSIDCPPLRLEQFSTLPESNLHQCTVRNSKGVPGRGPAQPQVHMSAAGIRQHGTGAFYI